MARKSAVPVKSGVQKGKNEIKMRQVKLLELSKVYLSDQKYTSLINFQQCSQKYKAIFFNDPVFFLFDLENLQEIYFRNRIGIAQKKWLLLRSKQTNIYNSYLVFPNYMLGSLQISSRFDEKIISVHLFFSFLEEHHLKQQLHHEFLKALFLNRSRRQNAYFAFKQFQNWDRIKLLRSNKYFIVFASTGRKKNPINQSASFLKIMIHALSLAQYKMGGPQFPIYPGISPHENEYEEMRRMHKNHGRMD